MCSIIWSETFIKTNVYKTNQIEKEDKMIKHYLTVFLISMVPIAELRAAIPYSQAVGLPLIPSYIIAIIGNMIPVPFIYLFARKVLEIGNDMPGIIGKFCRWCTAKGEKGGEKLQATFCCVTFIRRNSTSGNRSMDRNVSSQFLKDGF